MSYFKNIFTTGAISKTPERVLKIITDEVTTTNPKLVVELGAGKGEITQHVTEKMGDHLPDYLAFEIHQDFAAQLRRNFPNIQVLEKDALHFDDWTPGKADLIISSIPLSFFSRTDRSVLLEKIRSNTAPGGKAIILFHAFWLIPELKRIFKGALLIRLVNIPPYYIISYTPGSIA